MIILLGACVCLNVAAANKKPKTVVINTEKLGKEVLGYAGPTPVEITVTDGPGPQPGGFQITGLAKTGGNLVLTFAGEGTPAVLGTASLASPQEWTPVEGATVSGTTATVPMGAQNYIRLQ